MKLIYEPITFVKDKQIVQIIRPVLKWDESYEDQLVERLTSVDLSCCGLAYAYNRFFQTIPGALDYCKKKQFVIRKNSLFYRADRTINRAVKLQNRGWKEIVNEIHVKKSFDDLDSVIDDFWQSDDNGFVT